MKKLTPSRNAGAQATGFTLSSTPYQEASPSSCAGIPVAWWDLCGHAEGDDHGHDD